MENILKRALSQIGVKEIVGKEDNPIIVDYFKTVGHSWVKDDETAWCAAFVGWCLEKEGYPSTRKLNARSYLDIGVPVETPELGDIVIFWRNGIDSPYGHVAFYISEDDYYYYVLGGNQSNSVKIAAYAKTRALGFRRI